MLFSKNLNFTKIKKTVASAAEDTPNFFFFYSNIKHGWYNNPSVHLRVVFTNKCKTLKTSLQHSHFSKASSGCDWTSGGCVLLWYKRQDVASNTVFMCVG